MAKRFLTHIDLAGNQILNAAFEKLATDPTTGNFEGRVYYNTASDELRFYDGAAWQVVGDKIEIQGTTNEVTVAFSAETNTYTISLPDTINAATSGNAATATKLATSRSISLGGDLSGSASFDGSADVTITATIAADSVALGTDTTGNYVATVTGTANQVTVTGSGSENAAVTLSLPQDIATASSPTFAGVTGGNVQVGITGDNEIDTDEGNLTIDSAGGTVTVDDNLIVSGDLTVNGTTTTVNTETLLVADNIITLNSNVTASPTENAGIEVERGTSTNVELRWNETNDTWEATRDGATYKALLLDGDPITVNEISGFQEDVEDIVGGMVSGSNSLSVTYTDNGASAGTLAFDTTLATTSYLSKTSGLAVDIATLEAKLVTDSFTKKATASVGNGTNTSFAVNHNLNTRDVQVQVYDNATYDTVECDVVRTDANTVTVSFTVAPANDAYRVVVIG
jgi:hypothetical protein